jgi:hypothetical protein
VTYPTVEAIEGVSCARKAQEALDAGQSAEQFATTGVIGCCWHENNWSPAVGSAESITDMSIPVSQGGHRNCQSTGLMTQKQTVYGQCTPGVEYKDNVPCEYIGEWKTDGKCDKDTGRMNYWRNTQNSNEPTTKTEICHIDCEGEWKFVKHEKWATKQYCLRPDGTTWKNRHAWCGSGEKRMTDFACKVQEEFEVTDVTAVLGEGPLTCEPGEGSTRYNPTDAPMENCDGQGARYCCGHACLSDCLK